RGNWTQSGGGAGRHISGHSAVLWSRGSCRRLLKQGSRGGARLSLRAARPYGGLHQGQCTGAGGGDGAPCSAASLASLVYGSRRGLPWATGRRRCFHGRKGGVSADAAQ